MLYGFSTPRSLQILRHKISLISECLGIADLAPVPGFPHHEWLPPSRTNSQPCARKCDSSLRLFTQKSEPLQMCCPLHSGHQDDSFEALPAKQTGGFPVALPSLIPGSSRHGFLQSIRSRDHHPFGLLRYIYSCWSWYYQYAQITQEWISGYCLLSRVKMHWLTIRSVTKHE